MAVANNTRTAERVHNALATGQLGIQASRAGEGLLRIDTDVLKGSEEDEAFIPADEEDDEDLTGPQREALLRAKVNSVGKRGQPGADIRNVVSVAMLSEGWDCRTVTHIMGLRAFTSQLLCEQVIGRGLRRTSYEVDADTGLFQPEYVNVFGVPFTFLPLEGSEAGPPRPVRPTTLVSVVPGRREFEITWPNIARIQPTYGQELTIDVEKIKPIHLDPKLVRTRADLGALMDGRPNVDSKKEIQLRELADTEFRLQRTIFQAAQRVYNAMKPDWKGNQAVLLGQVVRLVEGFIHADRVDYGQVTLDHDDVRRRILLALNMERIVQHIWHHIKYHDLESIEVVFDEERPTMSTGEMAPWDTRRDCLPTKRSQINPCVVDSSWEADAALPLDEHDAVQAWAKNDHLGFEIRYSDAGRSRSYTPDFLIRLHGDQHLIVEVKGQRTPTDQAKWNAAREWVGAVNSLGTFGMWHFEVIEGLGEMAPLLDLFSAAPEATVRAR
jgi:type III restriction enzyme